MIAWRLGCSIEAVEAMQPKQFLEWVAFFELHAEEVKKHVKNR